MQILTIDPEIWKLFPEAQFYVLEIAGINNEMKSEAQFQTLLNEASQKAQRFLPEATFSENLVIQQWREAFTKFKKKKGARSSIEALLKRTQQGKVLTPINPLVDIYNSISLEFGVPCGAEDMAKIQGGMHLGMASGGEDFRPLGSEEDQPALPGEVIYYDEEGAICRCLNWREAQRTMITTETTDAVLVLEAINQEQHARTKQAAEALQSRLQELLNVQSEVITLTKE